MARRFGTAIPSTMANTAVDMRTSRRVAPRCSARKRRTPDLATPVPKGAVTPGGASQHAARHARVAPSESLAARAQGHSAAALRPVGGRRVTAAAGQGGLAASDIPCLLVEGDNRPGWGAQMARALADAGINIAFVMAQVIGRRFAAVLGLENDAAAAEAMKIIKKTGAAPRAARKTAARRR